MKDGNSIISAKVWNGKKSQEPKKVTISNLYVTEIDMVKRTAILARTKSYNKDGKASYSDKIKMSVTHKALSYGAQYLGDIVNVTLTNDGKQIEAFFKPHKEVSEDETF